ncbi:MAG TPA: S-adenosylmethionine tRNA ribosyltransferase [Bacteroidales bacterium]|nr:MAG: S-adenosylmethionine tRNA ribosyltransferase [Bacteroidetes bacterium GWF2_33_38]OFY71582.1 MAG: S-adenosylmethionine tRNA ribosyltransferase [Bacteroidetes bacterium RIFOXYA12_FULL_33_9]OFY87788.1 MAG: S-adenosylmethionine tRNA ribosyltransferase [Bacteroidetes bacterium RIFOXYA2_FULL_33_7]HBF88084.1 S-adenosylmethionine tRNA ribosyltransferase [Bacteroidales bacterium]
MLDKSININNYNYILDEDKIAKFPLANRASSKLLIYRNSEISESTFSCIKDYIPENALLVFNNTKVIKARLEFKKDTGSHIEIFCLEPYLPSEYNLMFQQKDECVWKCMVGNLKKWKQGRLNKILNFDDFNVDLSAEIIDRQGKDVFVKFSWNNKHISFGDILEQNGIIPIPPYLNRDSQESDNERYQTVYSKLKGSVAAPTAGLHFTNEIMEDVKSKNISLAEITLHVGAGTFQPVKEENATQHEMHAEHFYIEKEELKKIIEKSNHIFAVGTTTTRTLESIYWIGVKLTKSNLVDKNTFNIRQWEVYELSSHISVNESLNAILTYMENQQLNSIKCSTQIMITPMYRFKMIKGIITNFHQPKSTLLLLISAVVGEKWKEIYNYAIKNNFRFLSYGDSSILYLD